MDLLVVIILFFFVFGALQGFFFGIFTNLMLMYCDWKDGQEYDWGTNIGFTVATPLVWIFTFVEIVLLYWK